MNGHSSHHTVARLPRSAWRKPPKADHRKGLRQQSRSRWNRAKWFVLVGIGPATSDSLRIPGPARNPEDSSRSPRAPHLLPATQLAKTHHSTTCFQLVGFHFLRVGINSDPKMVQSGTAGPLPWPQDPATHGCCSLHDVRTDSDRYAVCRGIPACRPVRSRQFENATCRRVGRR